MATLLTLRGSEGCELGRAGFWRSKVVLSLPREELGMSQAAEGSSIESGTSLRQRSAHLAGARWPLCWRFANATSVTEAANDSPRMPANEHGITQPMGPRSTITWRPGATSGSSCVAHKTLRSGEFHA